MMNPQGEQVYNSPREYDDSNQDDCGNKQDLNYLTIDQLKSRLTAMNVVLDFHKHPKSFYLDIYREMLKDDTKRELIKEMLNSDHKKAHKRVKKGKVCQNFMKNKRKRTDEEETAKEEEIKNNQHEEQREEHEEPCNEEHNEVFLPDPDINIQVKKIICISISPSNVSTPVMKESTKIYKDFDSAHFQKQWLSMDQLNTLSQMNQFNQVNPLVRILDTDFSQFDKPLTPDASPYTYKRPIFYNNNFTFRRIKKEDQIENINRKERTATASAKNVTSPILEEILRKEYPRSVSFALDTNFNDEDLKANDWRAMSYNIGKYLSIFLGGSAVFYGFCVYVRFDPLIIKDIPKLPIIIFVVIAIGVMFLIAYLIKANKDSLKRCEELIAENIVKEIRENLIKKFDSGESQPSIDQEDFILEFCNSNNYKLDYFTKNILPLVKENFKFDQNNIVTEKTFYEDGKIKTLWLISSNDVEEN